VFRVQRQQSSGIQGSVSRVSGSGLRERAPSGLGFQISDLGFLVSGFGFRISGLGFRVSGFVFWVSGLGFGVPGFGFRIAYRLWVAQFTGSGFQVTSFRLRDSGSV
jgi:hypothetical protein